MKKLFILLMCFTFIFTFASQSFANEGDNKTVQTEKEGKKLKLSEDDKMIGGVAGGVAEYFGLDSNLVRLGFVLFSLAYGGGILLYLILFIVMS